MPSQLTLQILGRIGKSESWKCRPKREEGGGGGGGVSPFRTYKPITWNSKLANRTVHLLESLNNNIDKLTGRVVGIGQELRVLH